MLISRFHGDHMNGLKNPDGSLVYPNAEIKVPAAEWAFWADEANVSKANGINRANFANVKKAFDGLADKVTKMMVQGFHYPFPSLAYVEKNGNGYREIMVPWNPAI